MWTGINSLNSILPSISCGNNGFGGHQDSGNIGSGNNRFGGHQDRGNNKVAELASSPSLVPDDDQ